MRWVASDNDADDDDVDDGRFRVRSAPYEAARANANSTSAAGDGLSDFDRQTSFFPVLVVILRGLIPCVIVILLFHAAYLYTRYKQAARICQPFRVQRQL